MKSMDNRRKQSEYLVSPRTEGPGKEEASLVPRSVPSHRHIQSILKQQCVAYTKDKLKGRELFKMINKHLAKMGVDYSMSVQDMIRSIRTQDRNFMHNELMAALLIFTSTPLTVLSSTGRLFTVRLDTQHYSLLSSDELIEMQTSRFKSEFTDISRIGKGGFGTVFKATHKLDGTDYAIKIIRINHSKPKKWQKVLREVKALATLKHCNIVRYYGAWLEHQTSYTYGLTNVKEPEGGYKKSGVNDGNESEDRILLLSHSKNCDSGDTDGSTTDDSCEACDRLRGNQSSRDRVGHFLSLQRQETLKHTCKRTISKTNYEDIPKTRSISQKPVAIKRKFSLDMHFFLFIQMELCSVTLDEWIRRPCSCSKVNSRLNRMIFKQILKGVDFIHSQGLIHRDLKPTNIFINKPKNHVRIGDFGLASADHDSFLLTPTPDSKGDFTRSDHTSGVGTEIYASPEQLKGPSYNNKCDIYSLGVLLYEICKKFATDMEKGRYLGRLRARHLDKDFMKSCPAEASAVIKMTSLDPHHRPTAKELLQSELFLTKDQVIAQMKKIVDEKDAEIQRLNHLLEQERRLSRLQGEADKPLPDLSFPPGLTFTPHKPKF